MILFSPPIVLFLLAMLVVPYVRGEDPFPLGLLAVMLAALVIAMLVAYLMARRRIWVTLSEVGIRGIGINGREFTLLWSAPTIVAPVSPPRVGTVSGVTMLAIGGNGRPTGDGVFVPDAIARSIEFNGVVKKFAPPAHPLLTIVSNAA